MVCFLPPQMSNDFENHCWKDIVSEDVLDLYSRYEREVFVGPSPCLLAIDLYELAYEGGAKPISEISKMFPNSCGEHAWAAIKPTERLFRLLRGLPKFRSSIQPWTFGLTAGPKASTQPRGEHRAMMQMPTLSDRTSVLSQITWSSPSSGLVLSLVLLCKRI